MLAALSQLLQRTTLPMGLSLVLAAWVLQWAGASAQTPPAPPPTSLPPAPPAPARPASSPEAARKPPLAQPDGKPLVVLRKVLDLLDEHYLLPDLLAPSSLFKGATQRLAAACEDGLYIEGVDGAPDTLLIGYRSLVLEPGAVRTRADLVDALTGVLSFWRQARTLGEMTDEEVEHHLIRGMVATLDRPTRLLVDEGLESFEVRSRGSLIGVGLVLRIRDDRPTVREVVAGGPSDRGGLQIGDRILRIDGESTLLMPLSEVVSRLRGEAGTTVKVELERKDVSAPTTVVLTREKVVVENVKVARLPGDVGYLEIENFSDQTLANFEGHVKKLLAEGPLKGFVLDLRANRGGSLRQSAFLADQFLEAGTLVRTVGRNNEAVKGLVPRIDARAGVAIPADVPMVVLVSGTTASGAEILSGALKQLDRAVIVGRRTFGKGTVQKVYQLTEKASVKLTVARYLLPGDHWIQGVGIEPDVELSAIDVEEDRVHFSAEELEQEEDEDSEEQDRDFVGEAEAPPLAHIAYVRMAPSQSSSEPSLAERLLADREVDVAMRLLREVGKPGRAATLAQVSPWAEQVQREQEAVLTELLAQRQIDWSHAPARRLPPRSKVRARLLTGEDNTLRPGALKAPLTLELTVEGKDPLYQVRVLTLSDDPRFSGRDFLFGKVEDGRTVTSTLPITLSPNAEPGVRLVKLLVFAEGLPEPLRESAWVKVTPYPIPNLSASLSYVDDGTDGSRGDGDGQLEPGEIVAVKIDVTNSGPGDSGELTATLRSPLRKDIELGAHRAVMGKVSAAGQARAALTFSVVSEREAGASAPEVEVVIQDRAWGISLSQKLSFAPPDPGASSPWPVIIQPPRIALTSQVPTSPLVEGRLTLTARADDEARIRHVTLYDDHIKVGRALVEEGDAGQALSFSQELSLAPGEHILDLIAEDQAHLRARVRMRVLVEGGSAQPGVPQAEAP